jgi:hypothetical protein
MTATPASLGLTSSQFAWACKIIAILKGMKLSDGIAQRACDIALGTVLTESGLRMYANGHNPQSLRLPHDAVGWDHGSVGLYQQQVGGAVNSTANWGTTAQCMDVGYSTRKFLAELFKRNWTHMTNWDAAQSVQGSFDPTGGNYRRNDARAINIRKALWAQVGAPTPPKPPAPKPPAPPVHGIVAHYTVRPGDTLTTIAHKYPQSWITPQSIARLNGIRDIDHIVIGQVLKIG